MGRTQHTVESRELIRSAKIARAQCNYATLLSPEHKYDTRAIGHTCFCNVSGVNQRACSDLVGHGIYVCVDG